jgi:hypothetical protein
LLLLEVLRERHDEQEVELILENKNGVTTAAALTCGDVVG